MATNQPTWKLLANLGDVHPVDYGGYFIFEDTTGVYAPEAELLVSPDDDDSPEGWTVYRFTLDRCTDIDNVLSDNRYHPERNAWFADDLAAVAQFIGQGWEELRNAFCSADPIERAHAYRAIGEYHGFDNLDSYPMHIKDRAVVEDRYADAKYIDAGEE